MHFLEAKPHDKTVHEGNRVQCKCAVKMVNQMSAMLEPPVVDVLIFLDLLRKLAGRIPCLTDQEMALREGSEAEKCN